MTNLRVLLWVVLGFFFLCFSYKAYAEVNEYGVDCSLTPWYSSCSPDYSEMTEVNISDDGRVQIDLPFNFPFYGESFVTSWMYSNGVVGFMSAPNGYVPHFCCEGMSPEQIQSQMNAIAQGSLPTFVWSIAALWTDLIDLNIDHDGDGIDDTGFFYQAYDTNNDGQADTMRYFWRGISQFYDPSTSNTFEVKIDETGYVDITHFEIDIRNRNYTVGIFGGAPDDYHIFEYDINKVLDPNTGTEYQYYTLNLEAICAVNPLASTECKGYAEAYAELVYQQNCSANPLYDSGCPGYEQAYYNQQCSIDALYDVGCSGYAEAYYDQQCSLDPLYDSGCSGYEVAYFNQQCELDVMYDTTCPGYEDYILSLIPDPVEEETTETTVVESQPIITEQVITGDPIIDEAINTELPTNDPTNPVGQIVLESVAPTLAPIPEPVEIEVAPLEEAQEETTEEVVIAAIEQEVSDGERQSSSDVDEPVEEGGNEEGGDGESSESSEGSAEAGSAGGSEPRKSSGQTTQQKRESRERKVREIAKARAMQLAERMSDAATLEAQQAVQAQILALLNFNPDFVSYQNSLVNGGEIYGGEIPDSKIPENGRGLLNGLASQILHEKMVDMQYK